MNAAPAPLPPRPWRGFLLGSLALWLLTGAATTPSPRPAELTIAGYGFFGNRELRRLLRTLELGGKLPETFTPAFIEDATLLLSTRIRRDGYLHPALQVHLRSAEGEEFEFDAARLLEEPLPSHLRFVSARFSIQEGTLFYYQRIRFSGLTALTEKQALPYFLETGPLLNLRRMRIYTPEKLRASAANLADLLERQGYQDASVEAKELAIDRTSGAASVLIEVREGPRTFVRSIHQETLYPPPTGTVSSSTLPDPPPAYSRFLLQDLELQYKTNLFALGYPDVTVRLQTLVRETNAHGIYVDLRATVTPGTQVRVGEVRIAGNQITRTAILSRRVRVQRGDLLNPARVEQGRFRLAELGIFDHVNVATQDTPDPSTPTRDVTYSLKEARVREVSLLFGWGSYEMLRGGIVTDFYNVWGLAHHARLKLIQSIKASSGEFTYTLPDFQGREVDVFFFGSGLRREEVSFTRVEYGGGLGTHNYLRAWHTDATLRYNYEILDARSIIPAVASEGLTNPAVGSILIDLKHDRRDNPLYPRRGYKIFTSFETADSALGGDASYERIDLAGSWHAGLGGGRWLHLGLSHGVAISFGDAAQNLPFNRRYFPGGANSIRGYQEGEASPRNEAGEIVGAESTLLGSVELEQTLTPKWSLVLFADALGIARRLEDYPFDTGLYSLGGGIRWRTIVGPVRLEYGRNLNPRPRDPAGTLHFSLGFPF